MEGNPINDSDSLGLMGRGAGNGMGATPTNGQFGLGAQGQLGPVGLGAEVGGAVDSSGQVCGYVKVCGVFGMGLFGSAGFSAGGGIGGMCTGHQETAGIQAAGGFLGTGGVAVEGNGSGLGGSRGTLSNFGVGGGGFAGVSTCHYYYLCAKKCGCEGEK